MRIAWCTPFGTRSAIGRVGQSVVEELSRVAAVDVWHPPTAQPLETSVPRIELAGDAADAARLATYDLAVYHIGNHLVHRQILEAARRVPGAVVLHDLVLQDFFSAWYLSDPRLRDRYTAAMSRWYGMAGLAAARAASHTGSPDFLQSDEVLRYPLFEEAIAGAFAVVTHSAFSAERLRKVFPGPVRQVALPHRAIDTGRLPPREALGIPSGRLLALTFGEVNPNKRIHAILEALAEDPALASRIFYVVIGQAPEDYGRELQHIVKERGLESAVRLAGYLSDAELAAHLEHADFCVSLRHPTVEAASASVIAQLAAGKAVIVSDAGFYGELPDDCVLKIRPGGDTADLQESLRSVVEDETLRLALGRRARIYAYATFRVDRYAAEIVRLAEELADARPILTFIDRVGRELVRMGVMGSEPLIETVASLAGELFEERSR
jgi:glycosyltransferase involved in cell wall biosynthesis